MQVAAKVKAAAAIKALWKTVRVITNLLWIRRLEACPQASLEWRF
jgi:hypothetical protein